ncbi:MAG: UMP kinase, partial [Anaerolineales bacterium]|nr:UMP kinase [Anaerolineales bacterium]
PKANHHAKKFDKISYIEALNLRQAVMDSTAVSLCMENKLPILILNFWDKLALLKAIKGEKVGTLVSD